MIIWREIFNFFCIFLQTGQIMDKKSKPVHIIINPHSGANDAIVFLDSLCNELIKLGYQIQKYTTQYAGDGARYAREIAANSASAVVAFGGDGTVNEIASGLADSDVPILIAASGTENLLSKELKLPRDPAELANILDSGLVHNCDMGMINDRTFHSIIGVGFDAEVVKRVTDARTGHITHFTYVMPIIKTLKEHTYPHITVHADDKEIFTGRGLVFVGNISRYSSGLRICKNAKYDDGLLDLVVFKCDNSSKLLLHAARTMIGSHEVAKSCIYKQVKNIKVTSDEPTHTQVDGDLGPEMPIEIKLAPYKNRLFVPKSRTNKFVFPGWLWKRNNK